MQKDLQNKESEPIIVATCGARARWDVHEAQYECSVPVVVHVHKPRQSVCLAVVRNHASGRVCTISLVASYWN